MARVEVDAGAPIQQATGTIGGILNFFMTYWWAILLLIVLGIAVALAVVFYGILKRERLERDSEAYANYNNTIADCKMNANKKWIKKKYAFINLLWFGVPFKWNEHSAKLLDADRNLMGYYRGHFESQDNTINYLVYKTKLLGLFEEHFIIKVPKEARFEVPCIRKPTKTGNQGRKPTMKTKIIDLTQLISKDKWNDDIHFRSSGMQKISQYYRTPNFIYDDGGVIDLRQNMLRTINDNTFQTAWERSVNLNAKTVRKAIDGNPYVQTRKQGAEIEQENQEIEKEEEYR